MPGSFLRKPFVNTFQLKDTTALYWVEENDRKRRKRVVYWSSLRVTDCAISFVGTPAVQQEGSCVNDFIERVDMNTNHLRIE